MEDIQPGVVPEGYTVLTEGQASILQRGNDVFYNEAQVTNRDLSTAVLRRFLPMLAEDRSSGSIKSKRRAAKRKAGKDGKDGGQQGAGEKGEEEDAEAAGQQGEGDETKEEAKPSAGSGEASGAEGQQDQGRPAGSGEGQPVASTSGLGPMGPGGKPRGFVILEGLAASGLRSIRYAKEIPNVHRIDANDLDPAVCDSMRRNVAFNGPEVASVINTLCSDARMAMMKAPLRYDAIDLDPYGTPSSLLDSAVQSVGEGGLLLITATDMANLCGNNSVACWSNYSSYPLHRSFCHEQALRIILGCIEAHANRYKRHIVPLLSLSVDFYVRVFVRVYTNATVVKDAPTRLAYVWQSSGCDSFYLQRVGQKKVSGNSVKHMPNYGPAVPDMRCPDTGSGYIMGGPIWAEPIHDQEFVKGLLADMDRDKARYAQYAKIRGLLSCVLEELPDVPLYYDLHDVCKTARCQPPKSEVFRSAIINAGFRVSGSHANPLAIKTDAPPHVVWDIIRCWVKDHPVNIKDKESYTAKLLAKEPTIQANFSRAAGAMKKDDAPRFVQNPAYWGPKSRHGRPPVQKGGDGDGKSKGQGGKRGKGEGEEGVEGQQQGEEKKARTE